MSLDQKVPGIVGNCGLLFFMLLASVLASAGNQNNKKPTPAPSNTPPSANNSTHPASINRPTVNSTNTKMSPSSIKPGLNTSTRVPASSHATTTTTPSRNGVTGGSHGQPGVVNASLKTPLSPNSRVINFQHSGQKVQATLVGGKIRSIQAGKMSIQRTVGGQRRIESVDSSGRQTVSMGTNQGYVQRSYLNRNGQTYVQRTYVVNKNVYTTVYTTNVYRGVTYYNYVPVYYYRPVFYGWAYNPWPAPVYYPWGWDGNPWYGSYGYYFAPAPYYPAPSLWLTDYLLAENLQSAYRAQADAEADAADANASAARANAAAAQANAAAAQANATSAQAQANPPASQSANASTTTTQLAPEMKQAIAEEVKQQLAAEKAAAERTSPSGIQPSPTSGQVPPALDPAQRVFVVSSNLDVSASGQECGLTPGDVIMRTADVPDNDGKVSTMVTSSKKSDCASGSNVAVSLQDLQEMHNNFRQKIDDGLKTLAEKQGKNGLPSSPDTSTTAGEVPAPTADNDAVAKLQDQQKAADQTEADVRKEASAGAMLLRSE